jgi:hypothetical protein
MASVSALELEPGELDCLKSLATSHWFSVRTRGIFQRVDKQSIRATEIEIRSVETVVLGSKDIPLSGDHEAFRISLRKQTGASSDADQLEICGGAGAWLSKVGVLPAPLAVDLVRFTQEYGMAGKHASRTLTIEVPEAVLVQGNGGRLLVSQDAMPMWLNVTADAERIDNTLARSHRVVRIQ